jgi:hypothetical protein
MCGYMAKPVRHDDLHDTLHRWMQRGENGD